MGHPQRPSANLHVRSCAETADPWFASSCKTTHTVCLLFLVWFRRWTALRLHNVRSAVMKAALPRDNRA